MSNEIKHTDGPWELASRALITTKNTWRTPIAICYDSASHIGGVSAQEAEANARLIAAAPDLLEAVERLLKCPDLNLDNLEDETIAACDYAMEIRAKIKAVQL